jgi:transcription antitermination factor NusG
MTYFAFTARYEPKAAAELREAGFSAFCLMRMDRRRQHRHRAKGAASLKPKPVVALKGYVFANVDRPHLVQSLRHVGQAVRFCGAWQPIPEREMRWLLDPPGDLFHCKDIPRFANRPEPPLVKAGDMVRFTLASERHELPVMGVDGETLLVAIRMLGREVKTRVPVSLVELAA